jgi:secernin
MCDTLVVLGQYCKNGKTLFAKNSDRDPDEVQNIVFLPGGHHSNSDKVKCTYIEVPQVEETYDLILSQPFWMFGGEMGANKHGLVIGNEAVFTTEPLKSSGLLGMDMIRLALERQKSAKKALDFIITLLDTFGQGGGCGYHDRTFNYHNSFLIADPDSAYILETAGEHWVWKQITDNYSISNILTIETRYDGISPNAISAAIKKGRCKSESEFNFKKCYIARGLNMNTIKSKGGMGEHRRLLHFDQACALRLAKNAQVSDMINILRSHHPLKSNNKGLNVYNPATIGTNGDVCWHAGSALLRPSQSTNSFIAEIDKNITSVWTTVGSAPCIQMFRPLYLFRDLKNTIPSDIKSGNEIFDEQAMWWLNERLHRNVLLDYPKRTQAYFPERNKLEKEYLAKTDEVLSNKSYSIEDKKEKLCEISSSSFKIGNITVKKWIDAIKNLPIESVIKKGYFKYWDKMNIANKLSL